MFNLAHNILQIEFMVFSLSSFFFNWSIVALQRCVFPLHSKGKPGTRIHISRVLGFPSHLGDHTAIIPCE